MATWRQGSSDTDLHPNRFQRWVQGLARRPFHSRWLAAALPGLDRPLLRLSGGRTSLTTLLTGLPVVTLTTQGRHSGLPRRALLVGIPWDGGIALVASNFGQPRHPGWYYNLLADPQAHLAVRGREYACTARLAQGAERDALLERAAWVYPGYRDYQQRAGGREIGVFVLEELR